MLCYVLFCRGRHRNRPVERRTLERHRHSLLWIFSTLTRHTIQPREQGDAQAQSVSLVCSTGGTGGEEPRDVGVEVETRLPGIQRAADFPDCTLGLVRMKSYHERDSGRYCLHRVGRMTTHGATGCQKSFPVRASSTTSILRKEVTAAGFLPSTGGWLSL